jgi:hypothetical protein
VYVAVCPGATVTVVAEPEAAASVKSWPVPLRPTDCGLPVALSVNEMPPEAEPPVGGVKVTATVQLDPAATEVEVEQVVPELARANGPVMPIAVKDRLPVPELVTVTDCAALVVPDNWPEKVSEGGVMLTVVPVVAVPLKLNVCCTLPPPPALSVMVSVPDCEPPEVGEKITLIEQLAPAPRAVGVRGQVLVWEK